MNTIRYATESAKARPDAKLLVLEAGPGRIEHRSLPELRACLNPGDLVVVNDSGTLPASLSGTHPRSRGKIELRLASRSTPDWRRWTAVLFGDGNWRTPTESRSAPPFVLPGDTLEFDGGLVAKILFRSESSPRLIGIEWGSAPDQVLGRLYRAGKPIQYSYLRDELRTWDQQTLFAGAPLSVEPPSATFPLTWKTILDLKDRGIGIAALTHGAGLSSTGDPAIDRMLPLPEPYFIPPETASAIERARDRGGRIVAAGTTVMRALESAALSSGAVASGPGMSTLRIGRAHRRKVVDALLTGLHEPHASHLELLACLTDPALISRAYADAYERGYLWHEYGDSCLIFGRTKAL